MRKKIMTLAARIAASIAIVALAIFVGLEIFLGLYNPVETSLALMYEHEQLLTINGMIFREESYITSSDDKVLDYSVSDGEKVSAGDTVAMAYKDSEDADTGKQIEELQRQIDTIKSNSTVNDYYVLDLDSIKKDIVEALYGIAGVCGESGVGDLHRLTEDISGSITKKQAATGAVLNFSEKISELEREIGELKDSISVSPISVTSPEAGYFFSQCDGYENAVDVANITSMTAEDFRNVVPSEVPDDAVGKIAKSYEWYYLFTADRATAQIFREGGSVELRFPTSGASSFPAYVDKVNYTEEEALVVLRCDYMSDEYAVARNQTVQVVTQRTEGLFVDSSAIRINDGVTGVYVLVGVEVKFRKVEALYSCEEFVIAAADGDSDSLRLYDYIITKGNDLYDGKLIYRQT